MFRSSSKSTAELGNVPMEGGTSVYIFYYFLVFFDKVAENVVRIPDDTSTEAVNVDGRFIWIERAGRKTTGEN